MQSLFRTPQGLPPNTGAPYRCRLQVPAGRHPTPHHTTPHPRSRSSCCSSARAKSTRQQDIKAVVIDIDAVAQGLEAVSTAWAFAAAQAVTAGGIAGCAGVYNRSMSQLLPVLEQPHEAALMLRLLHEEGVVGARSTAGREGPVVGRPMRHSGSRPLLLNEILEHWADEIKPTCLLRWSRQAGCSCSQLEAQVQDAFEQAQATVEWEVLDVQQRQHGGSRRSQQQQQPAHTAAAKDGSTSTSNSNSNGQAFGTATVQRAAATAVSASAAVSVTVQPYVSVVPCLQHCSAQVFVASSYPPELTTAVLSAVQLQDLQQQQQQQQQVQALHGSTLQDCLQQLPSHVSSGGVLVVASSPSKALPCRPSQPPSQPPQPPQQQPSQQQQQQQQEPAGLQAPVQVAEWACRAPSLRARALTGRGLGLLSEWGLAELLGADSSDAVMDGIAWRS